MAVPRPLGKRRRRRRLRTHCRREEIPGRGKKIKLFFVSADFIPSFFQLHFVHWNRSKYVSPNEAAARPDGLAIIGVFVKVIEQEERPKKAKKGQMCDFFSTGGSHFSPRVRQAMLSIAFSKVQRTGKGCVTDICNFCYLSCCCLCS